MFLDENEIEKLIAIIEKVTENKTEKSTFRKSDDLFAIRQFHKEIPESLNFIFNQKLIDIIKSNFGEDYFITKSIYFDKPEKSNWFVSYHQDLTISVDKKIEQTDFSNWTKKHNQFAVQPPPQRSCSGAMSRRRQGRTAKGRAGYGAWRRGPWRPGSVSSFADAVPVGG